VLGSRPPESRQESIVRDLTADVFDFLYEWPRPLFEGRLHVAFPLGRRAYESLSLLSACYQDPAIAERWDHGKQIGNAEVRRTLAKLPYPEPEDELRALYRFFSEGTHPNRALVPERFLGDGNDYVLGSIGQPELVLVVEHCIHLIGMWYWYGAFVSFANSELLSKTDPTYAKDYFSTAERAVKTKKWLAENFSRLLEERQNELRAEGRQDD